MGKRVFTVLTVLIVIFVLISFAVPVSAVSESEVESQVSASGKESISGNLFIWFLCALSFLKISQKIDSFMSSLGINVGHTGGSMLGELMVAAKGVSLVKNFGGGGHSGGGSSGKSSGDGEGFLSGGIIGAVGRKITNSATQNATGEGGGVIGRAMFESSMASGGGFANSVIGKIANGSVAKNGTITGDTASDAVTSYMGYTGNPSAPAFTNVEIGGGRIMGTETSAAHPSGIEFGMYSADQYMTPDGTYTTETAADGSKWYKQYATDTVEKTPYTKPDGTINYHENIVEKLPNIPRIKERV